ncbi:MAG: hypothetical protein IKX40_08630 [Thermoguttaceae bacterium]|nr:hypothetical protein [Thermoguttaceae bacterium]
MINRIFVFLCCLFAMATAQGAVRQAEEYAFAPNNPVAALGMYSPEAQETAARMEREFQQYVKSIQAEQTKEKIRAKLLSRAEDYLASVKAEQGVIVPTAFVVEGLLDFGLPASDPYIRAKAYKLSQTLSEDGQVYDADGYRLHIETAYVHRILKLLGQNGRSQKAFAGDDAIHSALAVITEDLPQDAAEFLTQNEFALPNQETQRQSLLGDLSLTSEELEVLANWDADPSFPLNNIPFEPAPVQPRSTDVYAVASAPSAGFKTAVQNNAYQSESIVYQPFRRSVQPRQVGYVQIIQSVVLLI